MTRKRTAQLLTVALMAILGGVMMLRRSAPPEPVAAVQPKADPTPQDAIYGMHDAGRAGDLKQYLSFFSGSMETSLRQSIAEQGEVAFVRYLKESNAAIKGIAINQPQTINEREAKARVEYVYQDRNEVQNFYLEKQGGAWRILRLDPAEPVKPLVPYGTPVQ